MLRLRAWSSSRRSARDGALERRQAPDHLPATALSARWLGARRSKTPSGDGVARAAPGRETERCPPGPASTRRFTLETSSTRTSAATASAHPLGERVDVRGRSRALRARARSRCRNSARTLRSRGRCAMGRVRIERRTRLPGAPEHGERSQVFDGGGNERQERERDEQASQQREARALPHERAGSARPI